MILKKGNDSYLSDTIQTLGVDPRSKGQLCIPEVVLKNEGSMDQICRNINVHVVTTDIC